MNITKEQVYKEINLVNYDEILSELDKLILIENKDLEETEREIKLMWAALKIFNFEKL